MSDEMRKGLRAISPLIAVQVFLAGINIATGLAGGFWAIYPILAMGIPEFIIMSQILLRDKNKSSAIPAAQRQRAAEAGAAQTSAAVLTDSTLAGDMARVRAYRQEIDRLAKNAAGGAQAARMTDLARQFAAWEKDIQGMAERINGFKGNAIVQQDLRAVPEAIAKIEKQLASETNPRIRAPLENTLASRRAQLASLSTLSGVMRHAEVQFESAIASVGTIYSQALAGQGTNQVADYSHLIGNVNEQVASLNDQLAALEEVKLGMSATGR